MLGHMSFFINHIFVVSETIFSNGFAVFRFPHIILEKLTDAGPRFLYL